MALINLEGAVDLHIHSHPCLFPRLVDDEQVARGAAQAGLSAVLLKCHHESTVSRARALDRRFGELRVFGGIVLNYYVGGINPASVEAALKLGAREVWMPSIDSENHAAVHGARGVYDVQAGGRQDTRPGITVLDDRGQLTEPTREVLRLVADYDAILGTAHLSFEESSQLLLGAREAGVKKVLVTHPFFKVPALSLDQLSYLVSLGGIAEFGYCTVSPMWAYATVGQVAAAIRRLGPESCVIMSDCGQTHNPPPHEGLRIMAQCLHEKGLSEAEVYSLVRDLPRRLLGLD
ncbi:MAG: DUF6282 family protein [Bacillota bacterium]